MQRACAYFQGASEASEGSCAALREELRQNSRTVEALQTELTGLRQKQGVLREEAAAWRAEREALLAQRDRHAAQLAAEEQRSAALQRQLAEQHSLMLAQQGRMRAERAAAEQAAVGVRELREEVRALEHQLERAAAERALGQRHANLLEGLLGATAGAAAGRRPTRPPPPSTGARAAPPYVLMLCGSTVPAPPPGGAAARGAAPFDGSLLAVRLPVSTSRPGVGVGVPSRAVKITGSIPGWERFERLAAIVGNS